MADAMLIRRHIFLLTLTLFTALAPNLHSEVEVKVFVFVHRGSRSGELVEALLKREESGAWKIEYAQTTMDVPNQEVHALFDQLFINKERPAFRSSVRKIYGGKPAGITGTSMAKISENPQLVFHLDTDQKIQTIEAALERHPSPLTYQKSTTNWQPIVDYSLPLQAIILKTNMPARQRYQVLAKGANRRPDLFTVVALEELPDGKVKIAPVWPARRAMYLGPMTQIPTWTIDKEQLILDAGEQASVRSNAVSIEKAFRNAFGQPTATIRPTELQHDERLFSLLFNADELSLEREKIQWRSYLRDHPREPFYNFRIRVIPDTRTVVMIDRSSGIVEIRLTKNDLAKLGPGDPTLAIRNGGLDVLPGVWLEFPNFAHYMHTLKRVTRLKLYPIDGTFYATGGNVVMYVSPEGPTSLSPREPAHPHLPVFAVEHGDEGIKLSGNIPVQKLLGLRGRYLCPLDSIEPKK